MFVRDPFFEKPLLQDANYHLATIDTINMYLLLVYFK